MLRTFFLLAAAGTAIVCVSCTSLDQKNTLDIDGTKVLVPVPEGFVPLGDRAPRFRSFEQSKTVAYKLVEKYLTKKDLDDVVSGHSKYRERSLTVLTPSYHFYPGFDDSAFKGAKAAIRAHGTPMGTKDLSTSRQPASAEELASINSMLRRLPPPAPNRSWLGVYFETPSAIGVTETLTSTIGGLIVQDAFVDVSIRLHNRYVVLRCEGRMHQGGDVKREQDTCEHWAQDTLKANLD
jgi:hypothetical protein